MAGGPNIDLTDDQLEIIVSDVMELYGYDFTNYSHASLKRRLNRLMINDRFLSFAEFRYRINNDEDYLRRFVEEVTVNVTEMFRDVHFYRTLREKVLPVLATWPHIRIWHAGCSTGEEVYSMAILLDEAKMLHKSLLYATDINPTVLQRVREGVFPLSQMKQYSENYILSGGQRDFSNYYTAQYNAVKFDERFSQRMVLATHNLVSDGSFNEFQLIMCRNVMIYFDKPLQDRVLKLFYESLEMLGFLALGAKETLRFSEIQQKFKPFSGREKIYRKVE